MRFIKKKAFQSYIAQGKTKPFLIIRRYAVGQEAIFISQPVIITRYADCVLVIIYTRDIYPVC